MLSMKAGYLNNKMLSLVILAEHECRNTAEKYITRVNCTMGSSFFITNNKLNSFFVNTVLPHSFPKTSKKIIVIKITILSVI